eukprot:9488563-Pyramimonas_sp.AAC.1
MLHRTKSKKLDGCGIVLPLQLLRFQIFRDKECSQMLRLDHAVEETAFPVYLKGVILPSFAPETRRVPLTMPKLSQSKPVASIRSFRVSVANGCRQTRVPLNQRCGTAVLGAAANHGVEASAGGDGTGWLHDICVHAGYEERE